MLAEFPAERLVPRSHGIDYLGGHQPSPDLDGLEAMERRGAHHLLFEHLREAAAPVGLDQMRHRVEAHLGLPQAQREAGAEEVFRDLAMFTARTLRRLGAGKS